MHQKRRHLSTGHLYARSAKLQNILFAASWMMIWIGLPVVLWKEQLLWIGMSGIALLWIVFIVVARRFGQERLIVYFPFLAPAYCALLCTFAILLMMRAPHTWMKS
jgi:hypothetical protein